MISRYEPDEFKIWLKSFLITKIGDPLPGYSLAEYPHEYLYKINELTSNIRFQERLRCAVKDLFKDWNVKATNTETIEYYSSLLNLIAELPVSDMYPDLVEIALKGYYCGIFSKNEEIDVQTLILQVIAGFPPSGMKKLKKRLMDLVKKYALEDRYTPICFRISWQTRYENAIQYIKPLLECYEIRKFDIDGTIERFLLGCGVSKFEDLLIPMLRELRAHDMRQFFLEILQGVGVEVRLSNYPFTSENLLLIWEPYGQVQLRKQIFCDDEEIMAHIKKLNQYYSDDQEKRDDIFWERIRNFFKIPVIQVPQPSLAGIRKK